MKKITIGVVDDNKDFCDLVTEQLRKQSNMELCFVANDGREGIEAIKQGRCPDVLVLDLIMPHLDGFGVLEALNTLELPKYPRVIMTSAVGQDSIIQKAMQLGAQYYLVKPVNMSMLIKRIHQLQDNGHEFFIHDAAQGNLSKSLVLKDSLAANDLEVDITNLIHEIGVPAHIKGYQYMRDAITLVVSNMDLLSAVTKELYPPIAAMNGTTPSRVERAIRHAIAAAWNNGGLRGIKVDPCTALLTFRRKPTNKGCITAFADMIRLVYGAAIGL